MVYLLASRNRKDEIQRGKYGTWVLRRPGYFWCALDVGFRTEMRFFNFRDAYRLLTSAIVPRPIALVSTVSAEGHTNLAPFRFACPIHLVIDIDFLYFSMIGSYFSMAGAFHFVSYSALTRITYIGLSQPTNCQHIIFPFP